ncbi:MAG: enoyl-CoA hydratase/isomerase family protein [Pseudomonadota bacterium]|nr:enoyl-CoA hydratase/isomerase family protein [Pseudomonadota bacterium]
METGTCSGFTTELSEEGILTIRFDRPERMNGMSIAMKRDLIEQLTQAQMSDAVRVVLFTGSGAAFSAGDDLKGYTDPAATGPGRMDPIAPGPDSGLGTYSALRTISQRVNRAVRELDKLTIAAINGVAIQTGFSLALACDFRIAARSARMGSATLRFALLPDEGGHYLLVQHLGVAGAMDFLMRRRIVDADRAHALGLVHEVVADDLLEAEALALARELSAGPQTAMRLLKRSLYAAADQHLAAAFDDIAARTAVSDHHRDAKEGVAAFREKRAPRFE